ncbi:MAG: glycosyltransferase family 4 protein, partial [bacterium]|nr:glycosyltransferase family 4 protein [bacterium]
RARRKGTPIAQFNGTPVKELPSGPSRFNNLVALPIPFNFLWTRWIKKLAEKNDWNAIFVRETPLSRHALAAGGKLGIPVFLDMRENLTLMYSMGQKKNWIRRITRPVGLVKRYEAKVCPGFDHIFTVSHELGQWVEETYGVHSSKISALGNFPSSEYLKNLDNAISAKKRRRMYKTIRLIHTGNIAVNRGLQDILEALKILASREVPVVLRIVGAGPYTGTLKQQVQRLELGERVEFIPMLPPEKVPEATLEGDIGVCSYLLNPFTHQTLPGKLFEFMAAGLPVIASARRPVKRIVEKVQCGVIYHSREPLEIADTIQRMIQNPEKTLQMGENGRQAILSTYNQDYNTTVLGKVFQKYPGIAAKK